VACLCVKRRRERNYYTAIANYTLVLSRWSVVLEIEMEKRMRRHAYTSLSFMYALFFRHFPLLRGASSAFFGSEEMFFI
jgi:hypothetical protein